MENIEFDDSEQLMRRTREGDDVAAGQLLACYRERLRRAIDMRMDKRIAARADASDVVQDALNNAYNRLPQYFAGPQMPFYIWLRRIAFDRLMDLYDAHVEAGKRSVLREQNNLPSPNDESVSQLANSIAASSLNPSRRAIAAETYARIQAGLLQLRPGDREVLVMRYLEHMEIEDIAVALEISKTAVTSRHLRAVQRLRELLGNESGA